MKLFSRNKTTGQANETVADGIDVGDQHDAPIQQNVAENRGLFSRLGRTRSGLFSGIGNLFTGEKIVDSVFEDIEDQLLVADVGVRVANRIVERLRREAGTGSQEKLIAALREVLVEIVRPCETEPLALVSGRPTVLLMVGVNGVGKTTTLAKIAAKQHQMGAGVMLAACDTFRAAAIEQLQTWGRPTRCPGYRAEPWRGCSGGGL